MRESFQWLHVVVTASMAAGCILLYGDLRDEQSRNQPLFEAVKRYQSVADKWKTMYEMALVFNQATDNDLRVCKSMLPPEQRQSLQ